MAPAAAAASDARHLAWFKWLPPALFSVLWIDLLRQLSYTWETREQYSYGWFVPLFALYLGWRRWTDRPSAEAKPCSPWLTSLVAVIALGLLPLRVIHEINPDWPLISWGYSAGVVGLTLYAIRLAGGWPWVRHLAFPIIFVLVAVEWPFRIEKKLTQDLMQIIASLTVEMLGFVNIPAVQRGNLIEVSTGVLGVDEACSGIRSLQSSLMASLLMGELYRFRWEARGVMLITGLLLAFIFNLTRTLFLSWQASQHGLKAIDRWHDSAGMTITVACFFALWLLAVLIQRKWGTFGLPSDRSPSPPSGSVAGAPVVLPLPRCFLFGIACWVAFVILGKEMWFRIHESRTPVAAEWSIRLPSGSPGFRKVQLSDRENALLKQDISDTGTWQDGGGRLWTVYYLRWLPGSMLSRIEARAHRPEICLRASGFKLEKDFGSTAFKVGGLELHFQRYAFDSEGTRIHVFFCLWEDGAENLPRTEKLTQLDRLHAVLRGHRRVGQRSVEIIVRGYSDMETAEADVRQRLPDLIQIERATAAGPVGAGRQRWHPGYAAAPGFTRVMKTGETSRQRLSLPVTAKSPICWCSPR